MQETEPLNILLRMILRNPTAKPQALRSAGTKTKWALQFGRSALSPYRSLQGGQTSKVRGFMWLARRGCFIRATLRWAMGVVRQKVTVAGFAQRVALRLEDVYPHALSRV